MTGSMAAWYINLAVCRDLADYEMTLIDSGYCWSGARNLRPNQSSAFASLAIVMKSSRTSSHPQTHSHRLNQLQILMNRNNMLLGTVDIGCKLGGHLGLKKFHKDGSKTLHGSTVPRSMVLHSCSLSMIALRYLCFEISLLWEWLISTNVSPVWNGTLRNENYPSSNNLTNFAYFGR